MKVGIITLYRVYNFGSVLQAYASQILFKKHGCDVEIIDYIPKSHSLKQILCSHPEKYKHSILKLIMYHIMKSISIIIKEICFRKFIHKHINLSNRKYRDNIDLYTYCPKADVYITGSDQTWNSSYNKGINKCFFLDFVPKDKVKISFAASIGKTSIDTRESKEIKELLGTYNAISVREDSAVKIMEGLNIKGSICLLDPVLQVEQKKWREITSKKLIKDKYLILMLLYNEDFGATEYAREIANKKGLKLVKLTWELIKPKQVDKLMTHRTPTEFLSLFMYSDFVVTNSYHGLAFSICFNKQFVVFARSEYNTRIDSLLRLTGLENRQIKINNNIVIKDEYIDYDPVNQILDDERKKAEKFINDSINLAVN